MSMMIDARIETWPVAGAFVIARGAKTEVAVVVVELTDESVTGRGEATPIYYHSETAESCAAQVQAWTGPLHHDAILAGMPRGAARNALGAALWDYEAKRTGISAWEKFGLDRLLPLESAITVSLASPEAMQAQAAEKAALGHRLIKLKLSGEGDLERVAAVRAGAPKARLVVDANEAWTGLDVAAMAAGLLPYGVELIEQPVKAGEDHLLDGVQSPIPLCADESCQDRSDLARCLDRYQAINIKLDKTGGLSEAQALASEARASGLKLMVGCMLSTSLGIAPAWLVAQGADWVDLDGPLLLARDRVGGCTLRGGILHPPTQGFWGN